jgi:hypothetical protein
MDIRNFLKPVNEARYAIDLARDNLTLQEKMQREAGEKRAKRAASLANAAVAKAVRRLPLAGEQHDDEIILPPG